MTKKNIDELQPIFAPQSVAVIGASSAPFKWGTQTLHRLRTTGYEGALYPINPKEKEIMGIRAYPSVLDVPELKDKDASFVISGIDFPSHAPPPKNPVDFAGSHTAFMDATVINNLAQLDYIDGIISYRPVTFHFVTSGTSDKQREMDTKVGELLAEVPNKYGKPVVLLGPSSLITSDEFRISEIIDKALESSGIPCYQTMEDATMAMYTLVRYAEIKRRSIEE